MVNLKIDAGLGRIGEEFLRITPAQSRDFKTSMGVLLTKRASFERENLGSSYRPTFPNQTFKRKHHLHVGRLI